MSLVVVGPSVVSPMVSPFQGPRPSATSPRSPETDSSLLSEETHLSVYTYNLYFLQSATCSIYLAFSSLKHDSVHHYFSSEQSRDHISMAAIPGASIRQ